MTNFLTPVVILYISVAAGVLHLWRRQKEPRRRVWWVIPPLIFLALLNCPLVACFVLGSLEHQYPASNEPRADAGAVVILAGSIRTSDRFRRRPELGPNTLYRCLHGAGLCRANPERLVLLSGGPFDREDGPSAAAVMREFLIAQGVDERRILTEEKSHNTFENAVECGRILRDRGILQIILVTDAAHMPRAAACFRRQGIEIIPSPCNHVTGEYHFAWTDLIPEAASVSMIDTAWHEWVGLAVYRLRGRL